MKVEQIRKRRGPVKARVKENKSMGDSISEPIRLERELEFPDQWIAIAAYYIGKRRANQGDVMLITGREPKEN